jgi:hypothetical protein
MLGLDAWTAASRLFARQLQAAGFYHQAVTHLLACHQVIEAISVYRKAGKALHPSPMPPLSSMPSMPPLLYALDACSASVDGCVPCMTPLRHSTRGRGV